MQISFRVQTLVTEGAQRAIDTALTSVCGVFDFANGEWRLANGETRRVSATVQHAVDIDALCAEYDYAARSCLIVDVSTATNLLRRSPARAPVQTLLGLVAQWDCGILLTSDSDSGALAELWCSPTARRCTLVDMLSITPGALQLALLHVWHQTIHMRPAHVGLPAELQRAISDIPIPFRVLLWQIVRAPSEWNVDRLAGAFGITRRSLERKFARWDMPPPSHFLRICHSANLEARSQTTDQPILASSW